MKQRLTLKQIVTKYLLGTGLGITACLLVQLGTDTGSELGVVFALASVVVLGNLLRKVL
jgi:hypothetical protein